MAGTVLSAGDTEGKGQSPSLNGTYILVRERERQCRKNSQIKKKKSSDND